LSGKVLVFNKGLYGLRSSGARFHEHLSDILRKTGFIPPRLTQTYGSKTVEPIMNTWQDILVFSKDPMEIIEHLKVTYPLQGVGLPEYYLGGDFKVQKRDRGDTIIVCAKTYIANVCQRVEELFNIKLKSYKTPMASDDHPEMDDSGMLNHDDHSRYQMLIGCGQWAVTLDVMYATQTMARFSAAPKQEHMKRMLRVFGYLKNHSKHSIIIDTQERLIPTSDEITVNWKEQYPGATEELPPDMPTPKGKAVQVTTYVDADHAHDQVTRRSVTGILLFVNNTPIKWYSKRQNTVETSTYGAELVALNLSLNTGTS